MANITTLTINGTDGWVNIETAVQELVSGFSFTVDKTYLVQIFGNHRVCITTGSSPADNEGFEWGDKPFSYTHKTGAALYAKTAYPRELSSITVNISE